MQITTTSIFQTSDGRTHHSHQNAIDHERLLAVEAFLTTKRDALGLELSNVLPAAALICETHEAVADIFKTPLPAEANKVQRIGGPAPLDPKEWGKTIAAQARG